MELLALLITFALGALVGPFIWMVLMPNVLHNAQRQAQEANLLMQKAREVNDDATREMKEALERYTEARAMNIKAFIELNETTAKIAARIAKLGQAT